MQLGCQAKQILRNFQKKEDSIHKGIKYSTFLLWDAYIFSKNIFGLHLAVLGLYVIGHSTIYLRLLINYDKIFYSVCSFQQ